MCIEPLEIQITAWQLYFSVIYALKSQTLDFDSLWAWIYFKIIQIKRPFLNYYVFSIFEAIIEVQNVQTTIITLHALLTNSLWTPHMFPSHVHGCLKTHWVQWVCLHTCRLATTQQRREGPPGNTSLKMLLLLIVLSYSFCECV